MIPSDVAPYTYAPVKQIQVITQNLIYSAHALVLLRSSRADSVGDLEFD
jgi:hypothetical protein